MGSDGLQLVCGWLADDFLQPLKHSTGQHSTGQLQQLQQQAQHSERQQQMASLQVVSSPHYAAERKLC